MTAPYSVSQALSDERLHHGFFGREGGRSQGELASNNMSISVGDNPDLVVSNRSSAAYALGGHGIKDLVVLKQVHSTRVETLTERPQGVIEADAMVTSRPDLLLGILTADCAPVLFADAEAGIVGAAHAGWRGALAGITDSVIAEMEAIGATRSRIAAAIGPCIAMPSYEVDEAFRARFVEADAANDRFFMRSASGSLHFDLPAYVRHRLIGAGIDEVETIHLDTYSSPDLFYSFRRATHRGEPDYGRQVSLIGLAGGKLAES